MIKRTLDVTVSALMLTLLGPLLLLIMVLLRFTGEGEIFFFQERIGFRGKKFNITKFATMLKSAAVMKSGDYTVQNDPRVLKVGSILRKYKINEILQLWDVLRGEMSLVGPRPQIPRIYDKYPASYKEVIDRVRPGITGIGSLVFRDEEKILSDSTDREFCYTQLIIPYKSELETWYANNNNIFLDISLLFLTVWYVIFPQSQALWKIVPYNLYRDTSKFHEITQKV
jgi:lipopolysaccharide/colanic/teichoic acid biosynthesis glycosyltransferase